MRSRRKGMSLGACAVIVTAATLVLATAPVSDAARPGSTSVSRRGPMRAPSLFDNAARMDANNLDMFVTNHGSFAFDLETGGPGLFFPKGGTSTVVFAGGIWVGAQVNGETRVATGEYSQEFGPGPMLGGTFQPDNPRFKSYKIVRGNTTDPDYLDWPIVDGAPTTEYGEPLLLGDAHIWSVYNDADPAVHTNSAGSTVPLGVEIQQSTFAFNTAGPLGNVIFLGFKVINKGYDTLENAYISLWSDPDLGGFTDDLVGCDTTQSLGYCYNATNADEQYGSMPPAVAIQLLQGPVLQRSPGVYDTLGLTAFTKYTNGTDPASFTESYNYMRGLLPDSTPIHEFDDPSRPITTFMVTGDPVLGTGWLDTDPADRRLQLSTGPFTMFPGDSEVVIAAILVGQGTDRLSSITALRPVADAARLAYGAGFDSFFRVSAPGSESVDEGQLLTFEVSGHDPGGVPTLTASGLPQGATFQDNGDGTGTFQWTPEFDAAGGYSVTFTAHGAGGSTASTTTQITVRNVNRKPTANAGGPYTSFVDVPVSFSGVASFDADGDALSYAWNFGDGGTATGPVPAHTYTQAGLYGVVLTVSDGALNDIGTTTASIVGIFSARAFTASGNRTIRLGAGKPQWCVQIEPVGQSFAVGSVDPATIVMKSAGTGTVGEIQAIQGKTIVGVDKDGNGIEELSACFAKADLRLLFANLQGNSSVPVTLEASLVQGGKIRASLDVAVLAGGGPLAASVAPNPLNPEATLSFSTSLPGRVRVALFDLNGRLVRALMDEASLPAGYHDLIFDGRAEGGEKLASGVYFYRIESAEGDAAGRFVIAK